MAEQPVKSLSPWSEEDVKQWQVFDDLLGRKAMWNVSTPELVSVYRSLVWYAQLRDKIKDSQAEIVAVHTPEDLKGKAKRVK